MGENVGGTPVSVVTGFSHENISLLEEDRYSFGTGVEGG